MNNFSLALFCAVVIYVPLASIIGISRCRLCSALKKLVWLVAHPLAVLAATVFRCTYLMCPGEKFDDNFQRGLAATQQAIVFSIVDSMIYGNWIFSIVISIFTEFNQFAFSKIQMFLLISCLGLHAPFTLFYKFIKFRMENYKAK
jgi:glycosylphosphatidylinositol transamidase